MKRILAAASLALAALAGQPALAQTTEIDKVSLPNAATVGGQSTVLNGMGMRTRFSFRVYVIGLYLPRKTTNAREAITMPGAKRVHMTLRREVNNRELGDAFLKGIRDNVPPAEIQRLGVQLVQFGQFFGSIPALKPGDTIVLDLLPGKGMNLIINGKQVGDVAGDEFNSALLRIWLGDKPVQADLKDLLLGVRPGQSAPAAAPQQQPAERN
jgi:hypothetical protein